MTKPIISIDGVEREMNEAEYAQYLKDAAEFEARRNAKAKAEADKAALLAKLGITADEAKLLLS
jgi:hypothetical protein